MNRALLSSTALSFIGCLLLHCGGRSDLTTVGAPDAATSDAPASDATVDAPSSFDASVAHDARTDAPSGACIAAPTGGAQIVGFPDEVDFMSLALAPPTIYVGTTIVRGGLFTGALLGAPSTGGTTEPLTAPAFLFGSIASDGSRVYYPQATGQQTSPNGGSYVVTGLAYVDLATGDAHPIPNSLPPRSTSSKPDTYMIVATPARPGVYWIGAPVGPTFATTLSAWDAPTNARRTVATGAGLRGLAVDGDSVYWADSGRDHEITVYKAPLGGEGATAVATVPGGPGGMLLGVSAAEVVFLSDEATGSIEVVSKDGGPVRHLMTVPIESAWVDENDVYWTESSSNGLKRIPVAGGQTETVSTQHVESVAFDACNLYIASSYPTGLLVQRK